METYKTFVADLIASGVGQQLINSQILMSNPTEEDGFTPIPPAFHLMGQRFVVDSYVFTNVVEDRVPERLLPSPLDAMFVLGNRATLPLLENEIEQYAYQANLAALDYLVGSYPQDFWESSSYNLWLSALRDLNADTTGAAYPPVMKTQAWERRILNAQLGSWAHLKHDTVLYAKQSYTNVVCEYPDGWVDPYPDFYRRVGRLAAEMQSAFEPLGIFEFSGEMVCDPPESDVCGPEPFRGNVLKYTLKQIADTMDMLADIADMELTGERLNDAQIEFIKSMVNDWGECGGPSRDGWYTDIIYRFSDENAWVFDPTVADVHTDPNTGQILHVGVGKPMLMVTTVKTDCQLTAYAGAAFGYHEFASENMTRWTDEQFKTELESGFSANPAWTDTIIE